MSKFIFVLLFLIFPVVALAVLLGDANGDNLVNGIDFAIWKSEFINKTGLNSDFNNNGTVEGQDFAIWKTAYLSPNNTPTSTSAYQPQPPYYASFYYEWYKTPATDGSWSYWTDNASSPPNTWFSHYLPDPKPSVFDPSTELYSSNDYNNFKWQVGKMQEARLNVAIASWFGQNTKEDTAFNNVINNFMSRADNPYPKLRWAMYFEQEGFSDPSVAQITSDLQYIKSKYSNSPYFLKVNGKPVIFVYGDANDAAGMTSRWKQASDALGNYFYISLKVYPGYTTDPNKLDSWHQYAPAARSGSSTPYYYFVSPGFSLDGTPERLPRNPAEFETAVKAMVSSNATWKLVQTWNEWGEGTSVEPGDPVFINPATGKEVLDPNGYQFKNLYIDILARNLPPLQ